MRVRALAVVIAALTSVLLVGAMVGPVSAGHGSHGTVTTGAFLGRGVTGTDPVGDATFSLACAVDDRPGNYDDHWGPQTHTGQAVGVCDNHVDELDMTAWSLRYIPAGTAGALKDGAGQDGNWGTADDVRYYTNPGQWNSLTKTIGTVEATTTFKGAWPARNDPLLTSGDQNPDESFAGLSALVAYRNTEIESNRLIRTCESSISAPGETTYELLTQGLDHYEDWPYLHIWGSWEHSIDVETGQNQWRPKLNFGYYRPHIDDDIHHSFSGDLNPLINPPALNALGRTDSGLGKTWDFSFSADRKTVTMKHPAVWVTTASCVRTGGDPLNAEQFNYIPFMRNKSVKQNYPKDSNGVNLFPGNPNADDRIEDVFFQSLASIRPRTPVAIPTYSVVTRQILNPIYAGCLPGQVGPADTGAGSVCTGQPSPVGLRFTSDIDWLIGFGFGADASTVLGGSMDGGRPSFDPYGTPALLSPTVFPGVNCVQPELPEYPFANPGNSCAQHNPFGGRVVRNGIFFIAS